MYLRHSRIRKGGKTHTYWRLVRAVRVGRKVRQETVAQLGELDAQGRIGIPAHLRQYAGLASDAVVIGANDRLELWEPDRWHARLAQVEGSISDSLADLGI